MTKYKRPRYLHVWRDRHGKLRAAYRQQGQRKIPLPLPLYSEEFWIEYRRAEEGASETATPIGADRAKPGSINALIADYYASAAFTSLEQSTQDTYKGQLERFRNGHGEKSVAAIKTKHVDAILGEVAKRSTAQAHKLRKRLLKLFTLAVKWEYRDDNPLLLASRIEHKEKGYRTWTEADIAKFRKHWGTGTPQRLALEVLLNTGLRRSDAVKLGPQHREGNRHVISLKKSRKTVTVYIPVNSDLARHIAGLHNHLVYLHTVHGAARSEKAFTNWFIEAAREAGLPEHSSPHGLRKACCRRLADAGCTTVEIMSITGQSLAVVERYIREFNKEKAADSAMKKMEAGL